MQDNKYGLKTLLDAFKAKCNPRLLFENRGNKQTILKNTFWLGLAQGITGLLNFIISVYVIRTFGATEYGKFAYALSFVFIFSTLFDFGLSTAITREFSRDKKQEKHFPDIFTLKLILGVCVIVFIGSIAFFTISDLLVRKIILVLSVYMFLFEVLNFIYSLFRARQKMEIEALIRFVYMFMLAGSIFFVLLFMPGILKLSIAYMVSTFVALLFTVIVLFWKTDIGFAFKPSFNITVWKSFLVIGFYLALSKGVGDITTYTDSVFLGLMDQVTETGWYNAALKVVRLSLFPLGIVGSAIFPALTSMRTESEDKFKRLWFMWTKGTIILAFFVLFLVFAKADDIINLLYSTEYAPAATPLKILMVMATLICLHSLFYYVLLIFDQQKKIFFVMVASAIANVALNALLIPRYSMTGAAVASVVSHFIIFLFFIVLSARYTAISSQYLKPYFMIFAIACLSGLLMYVGINVAEYYLANLFVTIICGALLYGIIFFLLYSIFYKRVRLAI